MMLALLLAGRGFAGEMDDDAIKKFEAAEQERKAEFNRLNDLVTVAKKNTKEGKYAEACQIYDELKLRLSKESGTLAELMTKTVAEDEENCRRQWCADLLKEAQNKIDEHDYNAAIVKAEEAKVVYAKAKTQADNVIVYCNKSIAADERSMETQVAAAFPGSATKAENIAMLLRKAKQNYNANKMNEAVANLETVFLLDPINSDATYMLNKIYTKMYNIGIEQKNAEVAGMLGIGDWIWVTPVVPNAAISSIGIDNIIIEEKTIVDPLDQLDNIIIPQFDVKNADFASVLTQLSDLSRKYDTKYKTGVDIIYSEPEDPAARPQPVTIEGFTDIPLSTLIYVICRENGLYYKVDGSTVKISEKFNNLQTQNFQLSAEIANNIRNDGEGDKNSGSGGLSGLTSRRDNNSSSGRNSNSSNRSSRNSYSGSRSSRSSSSSGSSSRSSRSSSSSSSSSRSSRSSSSSGSSRSSRSGGGSFDGGSSLRENAEPKTIPTDKLIAYFEDFGIKFEGEATISYNPNTNRLTVTNTVDNLRHMSDLVRELNAKVVPMVSIEAKVVELTESDVKELGFQWLYNIPDANGQSWWVNAYYGTTNSSGSTSTSGDAAKTELITEGAQPLRFLNGDYKLINNLKIFPNFGEALFGTKREVNLSLTVNALDQNSRTEVLSAPKVVTKSGTVGQISMLQTRSFPTSWEDPEIEIDGDYLRISEEEPEWEEEELGIEFTVFPQVAQDNYTIFLQLDVWIRDYVGDSSYPMTIESGYILEYPDKTRARQKTYSTSRDITMPIFSERMLTTTVKANDGETLVLGGMTKSTNYSQDDKWPILGDIPLIGRLFSSQVKQVVKNNLYLFVSARILKHDGRPLRTRVGGTRPDFTR